MCRILREQGNGELGEVATRSDLKKAETLVESLKERGRGVCLVIGIEDDRFV